MDDADVSSQTEGKSSVPVAKCSVWQESSQAAKNLKIDLGDGIQVTGDELRSILDKQLVYISGGLEEDKYPILTFPEEGLKCLDDPCGFKELNTTLLYFKSLTCFTDLSAGVTVLLDARSNKTHGPVKQLIHHLESGNFPLEVHAVYIYIKNRIFGKAKHLAETQTASKLQITIEYLSSQKSLLGKLDSSNVTEDLGGTLCYDHRKWINIRLEYENIQWLHNELVTQYPNLTKSLDHCELSSNTGDVENLKKADTELKEAFTNKMTETLLSVDGFLESLSCEQPETGMETSLATTEHIKLMSSLKSTSLDLKSMQTQLESLWLNHKSCLDHMMRICYFNEKTERVRVLLKEYTMNVNAEGGLLGDTLESALEHGEKFADTVSKIKSTLDDKMKEMTEDEQALANPSFVLEKESKMHAATQQAIDSVEVQMEELRKSYNELTDFCQQQTDLYIIFVKFHMMTRQVQQWNQEVLEFLAALHLEEMSEEMASMNLSKIENFHDDVQASHLEAIAELAESLPAEIGVKKAAVAAEKKYEHTCNLLEAHKSRILKRLEALQSQDQSPMSVDKQESVEKSTGADSGPVPTSSQSVSTTRDESSESTDTEADSNVLKKRKQVYEELVATEKVYIEDLKTVLDVNKSSYYDAMDPEGNESIPLRLRDKRHVVFGNLPEIHKFHESVFSGALEEYEDHPEKVGECFLKFMEQFQMYSVYCKTKAESDALVNECTESQTFFKGLQLNLAHQLPLDAYLIKPVQRITKYQLLLKEMIKHSIAAKVAYCELKKALDGMLKVLKNLNDSLHVVGLKGFPDPFLVWQKPSNIRSFRFNRARERHVFLFERMVIFSKKADVPSQKKEKKSDNYLYKGHLMMAEVGMRSVINGQPLQFDLNLHGQQKVFTFQAQDKDVHDMWTSELKRLLEAQLILMKDLVIKSGALNRKSYTGIAKPYSRDSRFFAELAEPQAFTPGQVIVKRSNSILSSIAESPTESLFPTKFNDEEFGLQDEMGTGMFTDHYETLAPSAPRYYLAISDYNPGDSDESGIALTEGQEIEVIGINQYGWWWVRATNASSGEVEEGWVPASYLKVFTISRHDV